MCFAKLHVLKNVNFEPLKLRNVWSGCYGLENILVHSLTFLLRLLGPERRGRTLEDALVVGGNVVLKVGRGTSILLDWLALAFPQRLLLLLLLLFGGGLLERLLVGDLGFPEKGKKRNCHLC